MTYRNYIKESLTDTVGAGVKWSWEGLKYIWEYIDPSGISSWDELLDAIEKYKEDPEDPLNQGLLLIAVANALPNFGLIVFAASFVTGPGAAAGAPAGTVMAVPQLGSKVILKTIVKKGGPEAIKAAGNAIKTAIAKSPVIKGTAADLLARAGLERAEMKALGIEPVKGVKLVPREKIKGEKTVGEIDAMPEVKRNEYIGTFARTPLDKLTSEFTKGSNPHFNELLDKVKWNLGEKYSSVKGLEKWGEQSVEKTIPTTLRYILSNSDEKYINEFIKDIAANSGLSKDDVLKAIVNYAEKKFPGEAFKLPTISPTEAVKKIDDVTAKPIVPEVKSSAAPATPAATKTEPAAAVPPSIDTDTLGKAISKSLLDSFKDISGKFGKKAVVYTARGTALGAAYWQAKAQAIARAGWDVYKATGEVVGDMVKTATEQAKENKEYLKTQSKYPYPGRKAEDISDPIPQSPY